MILGIPDDSPGAAQLTNGSTSQTISYATLLESLPVQIWDTPNLDKALDGHSVRDKINVWLLQVSLSHRRHSPATDRPSPNVLSAQVVWCMDAGEISDPVAWEQYWAIYEECRRQGVVSMVLVNQLHTESPSNWEVQCESQLQRFGLSRGSVLLKSMRNHQGVSSPEYKDDSQALSQLIRQRALQNLGANSMIGRVSLRVRTLLQYANRRFDLYFRCGWVSKTESMATCICIIRRSDLIKHLRLCHDVADSTVTCEWRRCGESMPRGSISRHIRMVHLNEGLSICTVCGARFSRRFGLYHHLKYAHDIG